MIATTALVRGNDSAKQQPMTTHYLVGIFHWRDHAGTLDGSQTEANIRTLLWGCDRWLEQHPNLAESDDGRRLLSIRSELENWLERYAGENASALADADENGQSLPVTLDENRSGAL